MIRESFLNKPLHATSDEVNIKTCKFPRIDNMHDFEKSAYPMGQRHYINSCSVKRMEVFFPRISLVAFRSNQLNVPLKSNTRHVTEGGDKLAAFPVIGE
jgi:hypothetical protein